MPRIVFAICLFIICVFIGIGFLYTQQQSLYKEQVIQSLRIKLDSVDVEINNIQKNASADTTYNQLLIKYKVIYDAIVLLRSTNLTYKEVMDSLSRKNTD